MAERSIKAAQVAAAYRRRDIDPAAHLRALKEADDCPRCEYCGEPDPRRWCDCWVGTWSSPELTSQEDPS